jgi:TIR domain
MAHERPRQHLQLVPPLGPVVPAVRAEDFVPAAWQSTLFAASNPHLLAFIDLNGIEEADFLTLLLAAKPRFMIDLRVLPLFDLGGLNRKRAFALFEKCGTKYLDMSGRLDLKDSKDSRYNADYLAEKVRELVFPKDASIEGPICFLIDALHFNDSFLAGLAEKLDPLSNVGWEILKIPYAESKREKTLKAVDTPAENARNLVFISHANPEDNAFASWLGARLTTAGYEVWTDVTRLTGGEQFWDNIEDTIRAHAAKVVVVLSRSATTKNGVLDEINLAVSVERSQAIKGFVIPVRIDDLPFDQVRANLARKNIIDFHANWATGLVQLLRTFERDEVPRTKPEGASATAKWCQNTTRGATLISQTPETVFSNWLPIAKLPNEILLHEINADSSQLNKVTAALPFPTFRYLRLIGGFAGADDLQPDGISQPLFKQHYSIALDSFLSGKPADLPGLEWREAQNFVSSLLRQSWNAHAFGLGLTSYETASGATAWFVRKGLIDQDQVAFVDQAGKLRRKKLVGRSEKRNVFWHYAIEMRPSLGRLPHVAARTHIVFTEDGTRLIASKERMHSLRRSFCRSWWNDRWRDLLLAFTTWLSAGQDVIELPVGRRASIELGSRPISFLSPYSIEEVVTEEVSDEILDAMDWDSSEANEIDDGEAFSLELSVLGEPT